MRARWIIAAAVAFWLGAESRFSPSFFWRTIETSFANTLASLDAIILSSDTTSIATTDKTNTAPKVAFVEPVFPAQDR